MYTHDLIRWLEFGAPGCRARWLSASRVGCRLTRHYAARASQRKLALGVEAFLLTWGTETTKHGVTRITVVRRDLPPELRNTKEAERAENWIIVANENGALLTCYRREDAWRSIRRKCNVRNRRIRGR